MVNCFKLNPLLKNSVNWEPHCLKKRIVHLHENPCKVKQLLVDESVFCAENNKYKVICPSSYELWFTVCFIRLKRLGKEKVGFANGVNIHFLLFPWEENYRGEKITRESNHPFSIKNCSRQRSRNYISSFSIENCQKEANGEKMYFSPTIHLWIIIPTLAKWNLFSPIAFQLIQVMAHAFNTCLCSQFTRHRRWRYLYSQSTWRWCLCSQSIWWRLCLFCFFNPRDADFALPNQMTLLDGVSCLTCFLQSSFHPFLDPSFSSRVLSLNVWTSLADVGGDGWPFLLTWMTSDKQEKSMTLVKNLKLQEWAVMS